MHSRLYPSTILRRPTFLLLLITSIVIFLCYRHVSSSPEPATVPATAREEYPTSLFSDYSRGSSNSQQLQEALKQSYSSSSSSSSSESLQPLPRPNFKPGVPKPPGSNYSRALIVPRLKKEDAGWMTAELKNIEQFVYVVDDPAAPLHPPVNKGHEVMVYLTYLIDHYDNLPDIMIFMHSHRVSWHNEEPLAWDAVGSINRLSSERVTREGYMNMRCNWGPGCPDWMHPGKMEEDAGKQEETMLAKSWSQLFPRVEIPEVLAQPCCAQFAISRERALALPKSRYIFYRDWLLRTELSDYISGRVWEYLWHVVFTGQNVFCPEQHVCYCDGFGLCFGGAEGLDRYFGLIYQTRDQKRDLEKWRKLAKEIEDAKNEGKPPEEIEKMEHPEPGKDKIMEAEIKDKRSRMRRMVEEAKERGKDPRIRAEEAGRPWKEGDGF
ncbi:hypothetical protein AJ79_09824 [Helicocarpus griseus UAMH5409]|uniref:Uncharacterized protein n=1 Tax=Helicocarpus griseus UAMH5409 TaxID=1447875 RepID=A0A2B7WH84_9EURO|nr:hypothetical protein AJ79_09824 [Helicocarpus griseus UAMH5409]